ncbi:MAG: DUF434 domain-containing protein [Candidatus Aminicenantes bacterium]|nr:DUF434 domain-containing protein [Candidatus Aminicenantes bacterium]
MVTEKFKDALQDYYFLLNRDYAEKPAVKLVGDRYRLSSVERLILYRGVTSGKKAPARKAKLSADLKGKKLYIDGYNVLFTIKNYLLGRPVFLANDGFMRDCGEVYGKVENETFFFRAVDLLLEYLCGCGVSAVEVFFDSPTSGSENHAGEVEKRLAAVGTAGEVFLVKYADRELRKKKDGVIATSDSEIIDAVDCPAADLAREVLETNFGINLLDLGKLL